MLLIVDLRVRKIESGKLALESAPFDLGELMRKLHLGYSMLADARGQIQKTAREAANAAVTAETGNLLREVEAQLRAAAKKAAKNS